MPIYTGSKRVVASFISNYSEDQARDESGKWTTGASATGEGEAARVAETYNEHKAAVSYHKDAAKYHANLGNKEAAAAHSAAADAHRKVLNDNLTPLDAGRTATVAAHKASAAALVGSTKYDESPNEPEGKRTTITDSMYADMQKHNEDVGAAVKRFKDSMIAKGAKYDASGKLVNVPRMSDMTAGDDKSTATSLVKAIRAKFADGVYYRVPNGPLVKVRAAKMVDGEVAIKDHQDLYGPFRKIGGSGKFEDSNGKKITANDAPRRMATGSKRVTANISKSEPETPTDDPVFAAEATKKEAEGKADAATKEHERAQATKDAGDKRTEAINRSKLAFKQGANSPKAKMAHGTAAMAHEDAASHFNKLASASSGHNLESRSLAAKYAKEHSDCCDRHTAISEGKVDPQNLLGDGSKNTRFLPKK